MSLILDALKKSDRNRERGKVPDLQADHSSIVAPPPPLRRYRRWVWALLVLVVVSCGWWLWQHGPATTAPAATPVRHTVAVPPPPISPPTEVMPAPAPVPLEPAKTTPVPKTEAAVAASTPKSIPAEKPAVSAAEATKPATSETQVYEIADLPSHIAQGLPELTVSVHYFTPSPAARMVRINNRILREGGSLPGGIKIASIEKNGIIFELQGVRFRLPATPLAVDRPTEER